MKNVDVKVVFMFTKKKTKKKCKVCGEPNFTLHKVCSYVCQKEFDKDNKKKETKKLSLWVDFLWSLYIKARAGFKTEIPLKKGSSEDHILNSHHLVRKPNLLLRYSYDNGICITNGQHRFGFHGKDYLYMEEQVRLLRGEDVYKNLEKLRKVKERIFIREKEIELLILLKPYKMDIIRFSEKIPHSTNKSFYKKLLDII